MGNEENKYKIKDWNWTPEAIQCYKRSCICKGCIIKEIMENPCYMKHAVHELLKTKGKPPEIKEINMYDVLNYLDRGYKLSEIARILKVSRSELSKKTKAFGIKEEISQN